MKFRGKSELLMKHMATAEAKFQKEHKLLKANALKVSFDGITCINTGTIKLH